MTHTDAGDDAMARFEAAVADADAETRRSMLLGFAHDMEALARDLRDGKLAAATPATPRG